MSIYAELKRRNVFRVGAAYLVVGWLLLQVSDIVLGFIGAPHWVGKALIALLLMGLVPSLAIAWIFEVGPGGIHRDNGVPATETVTHARRLDYITLIALVAVALMVMFEQLRVPEKGAGAIKVAAPAPDVESNAPGTSIKPVADPASVDAPASSVAVLPFADLSPSKDQAYLADGLAEELLNALTRIDGLKVASRTTSFSFRDSAESLPEIARKMKVGHVIEGSVRSAGERLRITAQLIDVESDTHLWSETYDRAAGDIFAIQSDIASAIATALGKKLGGKSIASPGTTNSAAYDDYMQGIFHMNQRTPVALRRATELFGQAVEKDPGFARAYAGIAAAWMLLPGYSQDAPRDEAFKRSLDAARRSVEIDPKLPEGLAVLAQVLRLTREIDWKASEELFLKAIALSPNYATAHHWYGMMLGPLGRRDEAIAELRTAHALDPWSLPIETALAWYLSDAGSFAEAVSHIGAVLERQADYRNGITSGVAIHLHAKDYETAERLLRRYLAISEFEEGLASDLIRGVQSPQDAQARDRAVAIARRLAEAETNNMTGRSMLALLGADEFLLDLLERKTPSENSIEYMATAWQFQRLRGNPRFDARLAAHGLPLDVYREGQP